MEVRIANIPVMESVTNIIRNFIQDFDEEYDVMLSDTFCAGMDDYTIFYTIPDGSKGEVAFCANFIQRYPIAANYSPLLLSILHELGHLETEWMMEDEPKNLKYRALTDEEYFNLYNERIATDWAGEWLEQNEQKAMLLDCELTTALARAVVQLAQKMS